MAVTGFTLGSLNLRTLASEIISTNGWDVFPGMKSSGTVYSFTHGEAVEGRRFYRARDIDLNLVLLATNAAGEVTSTPGEHLEENMATLMGALHNTFGTIPLVRTLPSGVTRTAHVRPLDLIPFEDANGLTRLVTLTLRMGYPFWHGASASISGSPSLVPNYAGNAPCNDMVFTFTTAGRITHDLTGDYIESSAAGLVVDVHTGEITGDPAALDGNTPWWIQLEPGEDNTLTVTGGDKQMDLFHGYF